MKLLIPDGVVIFLFQLINFQVMLDTVGPELPVCNQTGKPIELKADDHLTITSDVSKEPSAEFLPVDYCGLSEVCVGRHSTLISNINLFSN